MELNVRLEYLDELLKCESDKLVRKVLKRHEIFGYDDKKLKCDIKELIHEEFQDLLSLLVSAGRGVEKSFFKFEGRDK